MTSRFYLETYGCSLNMADSDLIIGRLHHLGFQRTDDASLSDVIILNSCGVKEPTEDRIISRLEVLSEGKIPVIVTGCLPRISFDRVKGAIPNFGAILGPQSLESLGPIVQRVLQGESGIIRLESDTTSKLQYYESPLDAVVCTIPICEGCVGDCAYCAVKFARTEVQSYRISDLLEVIQRCIHNGFKEIRLTAQDIGAFGLDTGESLIDLLTQVGQLEGTHKFRLGMFNPNLVLERLEPFIDAMQSPHFFEFFHVPLQSGSDAILRRMNRRYSVQEWKDVIQAIVSSFPRATIATDIIVGFPGETAEDFEMTLAVLQETHPPVVNLSKYGDRPGTLASKASDKVPTQIKKDRSRQLSKQVARLATASNESWIGWSGNVIITGSGQKGQVHGRTHTYKPVIINKAIPLGAVIEVTITDAKRTHLLGMPI